MTHVVVRRLPLDWCDPCSTLWFDEGELGSYLALSQAHRRHPLSEKLFVPIGSHGDLRCPRCQFPGGLQEGVVRSVPYLKCESCNGVLIPKVKLALLESRSDLSVVGETRSALETTTVTVGSVLDYLNLLDFVISLIHT